MSTPITYHISNKKTGLIAFVAISCMCIACQQNPQPPKHTNPAVNEIPVSGNISDIIRNPTTANKTQDTTNIAKITFTENTYNFGSIPEGDTINHTFTFTNTGQQPLLISDARSTCGCTVPSWPKKPILPGQSSEINVSFRTKDKPNQQRKPVTITANTHPPQTTIYLEGIVSPTGTN